MASSRNMRHDAIGQHIIGIDGVKGSLRRASPALDPVNTEDSDSIKEADKFAKKP